MLRKRLTFGDENLIATRIIADKKLIAEGHMNFRSDCRFFTGRSPCVFHKKEGMACHNCPHYSPVGKQILIVKLGAAGDVIRTTPILRKLKEIHPDAVITWVTYFPQLVPSSVDYILDLDAPIPGVPCETFLFVIANSPK